MESTAIGELPDPAPKAADGAQLRDGLGPRVRTLRERVGLNLRSLSERSGISQSALSKLENGQLSPTYETIIKLAAGLGVDIPALFSDVPPPSAAARRTITRRDQGVMVEASGYQYQFICGDLLGAKMKGIISKLTPDDGATPPRLNHHQGEELMYVLDGMVMLHTEFYAPALLETGDSVYLDSRMGHAVVAHGGAPAQVLWVVTGDTAVVVADAGQ